MLDFADNFYEVTVENKKALWQMIKDQGITLYNGDEFDFDYAEVGYVLGNIDNLNPKETGVWGSRECLSDDELVKVTTELPAA